MSSPASNASRRSRRAGGRTPSSPGLVPMPSTPSSVQQQGMDTSLLSSPPAPTPRGKHESTNCYFSILVTSKMTYSYINIGYDSPILNKYNYYFPLIADCVLISN